MATFAVRIQAYRLGRPTSGRNSIHQNFACRVAIEDRRSKGSLGVWYPYDVNTKRYKYLFRKHAFPGLRECHKVGASMKVPMD